MQHTIDLRARITQIVWIRCDKPQSSKQDTPGIYIPYTPLLSSVFSHPNSLPCGLRYRDRKHSATNTGVHLPRSTTVTHSSVIVVGVRYVAAFMLISPEVTHSVLIMPVVVVRDGAHISSSSEVGSFPCECKLTRSHKGSSM